ncbi:MAG: hypothetical protein SVS85_00510 [Candidatus Nanohaloarchaea archaeon]|nr:hypothetical protein [Candidatus Nanohaloarchaea archaeon]
MAEDFFDVDEDEGKEGSGKEAGEKDSEHGVSSPEKKHRLDTDFEFDYDTGDATSFSYNTDTRAKLSVAVLLVLFTYYLAGSLGAVPLF